MLLLTMLGDRRLHLTAIAKLAPYLTLGNREALLSRAAHQSKRQIEELVAKLAPRPDAPAVMQTLSPPTRRTAVEPLAPSRYKVQFTASAALHDKLERLQALMRSSLPDGDLAAIIEPAVTEKLERLEAKRFARTKAPRTSPAQADSRPSSRYIPAAVRRAVHERDGGRCRFVDEHGRRCTRATGSSFTTGIPSAMAVTAASRTSG